MQVVTHVSTAGAHESDQHAPLCVLDDLEQKGCQPDSLLTDTNYGRGQNIVDAVACGVDLASPSCGPKPKAEESDFILDDFMNGHAPASRRRRPYGLQRAGPRTSREIEEAPVEGVLAKLSVAPSSVTLFALSAQ